MGISGPDEPNIAHARDIFHSLLEQPTREAQWQQFFAEHPYVLSMSLPLRLEPKDIVPLGRPGKTEPDFVFYPSRESPIPYYGVIELKKPRSEIVTVTRANTAILTRDAETAISQASAYVECSSQHLPIEMASSLLFLGNRAHIFVIMGMSTELSEKLGMDIYRQMVEKRLPPNLQLIPYDSLLGAFEANISPRIHFLAPELPAKKESRHELLERVMDMFVRLERWNEEVANSIVAPFLPGPSGILYRFFRDNVGSTSALEESGILGRNLGGDLPLLSDDDLGLLARIFEDRLKNLPGV